MISCMGSPPRRGRPASAIVAAHGSSGDAGRYGLARTHGRAHVRPCVPRQTGLRFAPARALFKNVAARRQRANAKNHNTQESSLPASIAARRGPSRLVTHTLLASAPHTAGAHIRYRYSGRRGADRPPARARHAHYSIPPPATTSPAATCGANIVVDIP
ncbi:MAG: hypothetical protein RLW62_04480 [Gammaproteobacteria bacterium]